jgi:ATP-binding cassette subfamily C protein
LLWARPDASEDELWEALRLAGAGRFVSRLDRGIDTVVRDRGGRLSGGERQRIALARALLIRPTLLLLDEATSEVDQKSQQRILDSVAGLRGKMTIVIIAHHAPVEGIADQVLLMDQGTARVRKPVH